jgi:anti-sigma B factor antagonist
VCTWVPVERYLPGVRNEDRDTPSGEAGDRIVNIAQGQDKRVLLNLEKLEYVSSAGLRVILRGAKMLQVNRGELKICNARGIVRNVLETCGFDSLIKIYDSEKEAFSSFLGSSAPSSPMA